MARARVCGGRRGRVAVLPRHRLPGWGRRTDGSVTPPGSGFYSGRQVQGLAPRIREVVASVPLTAEDAATRALSADPVERRVGEALAAALHDGATAPRVSVVLLSPPDDPDTASFEPVDPRRRGRLDAVPAVRRPRPAADRAPRPTSSEPGELMTSRQPRGPARAAAGVVRAGRRPRSARSRRRSASTSAGRSARRASTTRAWRRAPRRSESFLDKATKSDGRGGFKYADPTTQLTDLVGARVLVPLSADVAPVARLVQRLYVVEEMSDQRADSLLDVPGYQSLHFLVRFRDEDREALGVVRPAGRGPGPLDPPARLGRAAARPDVQGRTRADRPRPAPADRAGRPARAGRPRVHGGPAGARRRGRHARRRPRRRLRRGRRPGLGGAVRRRRGRHRADGLGRRAARRARPGSAPTTAEEATALLGEWAGRGPELARTVRADAAVGHGVVRRRPGPAARARRRLPRPPRGQRPRGRWRALERECRRVRTAMEVAP